MGRKEEGMRLRSRKGILAIGLAEDGLSVAIGPRPGVSIIAYKRVR